ncbi:MAG TPA: hypothetical protein VFD30_10600, partial [Terriglobia bacterium]|nr:hypothetical protein [Terriglobia bacterium]
SPDVVQDSRERQFAQLVRGEDRYGHFEIVSPPREGIVNREIQEEALRRVLSNILPQGSGSGERDKP